jgi:hypothetical protein
MESAQELRDVVARAWIRNDGGDALLAEFQLRIDDGAPSDPDSEVDKNRWRLRRLWAKIIVDPCVYQWIGALLVSLDRKSARSSIMGMYDNQPFEKGKLISFQALTQEVSMKTHKALRILLVNATLAFSLVLLSSGTVNGQDDVDPSSPVDPPPPPPPTEDIFECVFSCNGPRQACVSAANETAWPFQIFARLACLGDYNQCQSDCLTPPG